MAHTLRGIWRRLFKLVAWTMAILIVVVGVALFIVFDQDRLNRFAQWGLAQAFDTEATSISLDKSATDFKLPGLNGRGFISFSDFRVRSVDDEYDVVYLPKLVVHFDLFSVLSRPLSRIEVPDGVSVAFMMDDEGNWADAAILKEQEKDDEPSSFKIELPEILIRNAWLHYRVPGELADPTEGSLAARMEFRNPRGGPEPVRFQGKPVQKLSNISLSLLRSRDEPGALLVRGESDCKFWGRTLFQGVIRRDLSLDVRVLKQDMLLDQSFYERIGEGGKASDIRDLLLPTDDAGKNELDLSVRIFGGGEDDIDMELQTYFRGNFLYRNIPGLVQQCHAQVNFRLSSGELTILNGIGMRGAGRVFCNGAVRGIGTDQEVIEVNVRAQGVAVNSTLRNALRGEVNKEGERTYPEFERYGRKSPTKQPKVASPFDLVARMCLPSGLADAEVTVIDRYQGGTDVSINATMLDFTATYMGTPATTAGYMSETLNPTLTSGDPGLRSVNRLLQDDGLPASEPAIGPPFTAFPLTVYNMRGVVSGRVPAGGAPLFRVRGFNQEEVERLERVHPSMAGNFRVEQPDAFGVQGHRGDDRQRVFAAATELKLGSPRDAEGVDTSRLQIQVKTEGFQFDPQLKAMLPPKVQSVLDRLSPNGKVDVQRGSIVIDQLMSSPAVNLEFNFQPKSMTAGFTLPGATQPIPLVDVTGSITQLSTISETKNQHTVRVNTANANVSSSLGGGEVGLKTFLIETARPREHMYMELGAKNIAFDESLFAYLPKSMTAVQELFTPSPMDGSTRALSGEVDVSVRFGIWPGARPANEMRDHPGAGEVLEIRLSLRNARFALKAFAPEVPYFLRDVSADIVVLLRDDEGVEIQIRKLSGVPEDERLLAGEAPGTIYATGSVIVPPGRTGEPLLLDMHVDAKNVLAGPKLRKSVDNFLGKDNAVGKLWTQLEAQPDQPLGLIDLVGDIRGRIPLGEKPEAATVKVSAEAGAAANQPATVESKPAPDAKVEAKKKKKVGDFDYLIDVRLHDGTLTYDLFRLPLTEVEGTLSIRSGPVVEFRDFRAKAPNGSIEMTRVEVVDGVLFASVSARAIPFDDTLRKAASGIQGIAKVLELIDPQPNPKLVEEGRTDTGLMNLELSVEVRPNRIDLRPNRVEVINTDLTIGVRFEQCTGVWETETVLLTDPESGEGSQLFQGSVQFSRVVWKGLVFTDISSRIENDGKSMNLPNVRGQLHGGTLRGNFWLSLEEGKPDYLGRFQAQNVLLQDAAKALAGTQSQDEDVGLSGGLSGELSFHPVDATGLVGKGRMDISREPLSQAQLARFDSLSDEERKGKLAELGKVPLFSGMYEALGLSRGEYFNEAHMVFHLLQDRMKIRQLEFISNFMRVEAEGGYDTDQEDLNPYAGTIYLSGKLPGDTNYILYSDESGDQLALTLVPSLFPRAPNIPGFKYLFDPIKGTVFKVYVTGTFAKPSVEPFTRARDPDSESEAEVYPDYSPLED